MMKVPMLDLKAQYAQIKETLVPRLLDLFEQQTFILGPVVEKMEKEAASYLGTKFALGVSSGTDALLIALMALGIGHGDEVITTAYSFFATAGAIHRVGAKPVFVDIESDTYNIDASKIEARITSKTKAIMPVHLFGQAVDMDAVMSIAKKHKLPVIEDAAQALSSRYRDVKVGNIGTIGCFSFFPSKNLGCFGDGGLVSTNDENLYERLKGLRVHGGQIQYHHQEVGINGRLDALQAVVVSEKLPHLDSWTEGRRKNAELYDNLLSGRSKIVTPVQHSDRFHIYNQYVIRTPLRDELKKHLTDQEIGCAIYYPVPLHLQECFAYLGHKPGDFPVAEAAARQTLALPVYPELSREAIEHIAKTIVNFVN